MTEHRLLTGAALHEPKGADTATAGRVYVSDGAGSGVWTDRLSGIYNTNKFTMNSRVPDVSETTSAFAYVAQKGNLTRITATLANSISVANSVLTLYKNGIVTTVTLTVPYTASVAGTTVIANLSPVLAVAEGDLLELRSNGGSTTAAELFITFVGVATA